MATGIGEFLDKGWNILAPTMNILKIIGIVVLVMGLAGAIIWYFWNKKKWNLKVEFKIPRGMNEMKSEEEIKDDEITGFVSAEWGKGSYDAKRGVVWVKRKWMSKSPVKPFDVKRYVQGGNILTVVQVGVNKYSPIISDSFIRMRDAKTGEEGALLRTKMDASETQSWGDLFERQTKAAYSVSSLLKEYVVWIGMGIIMFFNFVGFAILYTRIT